MKTRKGYSLRTLGKEYILVPEGVEVVNFTRMVSMNESSAFLWKAVEGKDFDVEMLSNLLVEEYGIDHETALHDAEALLQSWQNAGVID